MIRRLSECLQESFLQKNRAIRRIAPTNFFVSFVSSWFKSFRCDDSVTLLRLLVLLVPFAVTTVAFAQEDTCPTLERAAVAEARVWCSETQTGEACYGNSPVSADVDGFQAAGDRVSLDEVGNITTSSDTENNLYGVSLLRTLAYAPDAWTQQSVTLVLLGDLALTNAADSMPREVASISAAQGVNVRALPTEEGRIITPLFQGEVVMLTGQTADASWLRLLLPDGQTGWMVSSAIESVSADLPVVDADSSAPEAIYEPFADVELRTAMDDSRCAEAWESGLLLQSTGDDFVSLRVNGETLLLKGTAFLQTNEEEKVIVSVLAGEVQVGEEVIREGYEFALTLPDNAQPYDFAQLAYLPTEILPQYVYIGIDLTTIIIPAPQIDRSPIADVLATDRCIITTGPGGANLRGGPGREFPIRGVMDFRETAYPIGRTMGSDGAIWWELAQDVWISAVTTVTGGDCVAVPQSQRIPVPPPTPTPES